ncbi:hypothetical protein ACQKK5_21605 [Brevibacillus panacihumi]|uniref:hypothetical protein n=1 Tax=Brevibacillus panacihumi TaxID=497735 RepID=UPI003D04E0A7
MKKKLTMVLVFLLLTISIMGCSTQGESPEDTVSQYLAAIKNKEVDKAYEMLGGSNVPDKDRFKASIERHQLTEFKILETQEGENGVVSVKVQYKIQGAKGVEIPNELTLSLEKKGDKWGIIFSNDSSSDNQITIK